MKDIKLGFGLDAPASWSALFVRVVKVAIIAFVVLQLKELVDAGAFDIPGTAVDAALIAGGILVLDAILMRVKS